MSRFYRFSCLVLLLILAANANSKWTPIKDPDREMLYLRVTYTANEDFTYEEVESTAVKVLNKRAIPSLKRRTVGYNANAESINILEAYNLKADGTKLEVPKDNYQTHFNNKRWGKVGPVFSDHLSITTIFPEVEVGDTLVFAYKRTVWDPMFRKYFTAEKSFSKSTIFGEVTIDLIVPTSFQGLHQVRELKEEITKRDDQVHYHWTWQNRNPIHDTKKSYPVRDMGSSPGFAYSTFNNYKAIAEAYAQRALPKVVVSPQIHELANKIVGGEKDKREQARLLYEWVATKINYVGYPISVGAVAPHDLSFVLDNHMGDSKDHATLLQALLAAKNIQSEQALINVGRIYKLPTIPSVNAVNHVINYLPEWDLFVDTTDSKIPFGMLPSSVEGKPVLLAQNFVANKKTPVPPVGTHSQKLTTDLEILPDGSIKGKVELKLHGRPALLARSSWRNVSKDREKLLLKNMFVQNGKISSVRMEGDNPKPLRDNYNYSLTFEEKEFLVTDSAGAFPIHPPIHSYLPISKLTWVPEKIVDQPIPCSNVKSEERYTYRFPNNFKVLKLPRDEVIDGEYLHYEAHYKQEGTVLSVVRTLEDSTPGPICSPELITSQWKTLKKISRNLRSQIAYKPLLEDE